MRLDDLECPEDIGLRHLVDLAHRLWSASRFQLNQDHATALPHMDVRWWMIVEEDHDLKAIDA